MEKEKHKKSLSSVALDRLISAENGTWHLGLGRYVELKKGKKYLPQRACCRTSSLLSLV
jgi:hypothetical protein